MPDLTDAMKIGTVVPRIERQFQEWLSGLLPGSRVLELGTRRWDPKLPTHHQDWLPDGVELVKADYMDGTDVDVVADAMNLTNTFREDSFDAAIAVSVWEHIDLPWVAALSLADVLRPGAQGFICTHQTFPIHGYPSDFCRWSTHGLEKMFQWAGLTVVKTAYAYPAKIIPPAAVKRWDPTALAWLNVMAIVEKPDIR